MNAAMFQMKNKELLITPGEYSISLTVFPNEVNMFKWPVNSCGFINVLSRNVGTTVAIRGTVYLSDCIRKLIMRNKWKEASAID